MAHSSVLVDETAIVASTAVLGVPYRPLLNDRQRVSRLPTRIGAGCFIGEGATIGEGTELGANTVVDAGVRISSDVIVGTDVLLLYGCFIDMEARIGDGSVIGNGFVCERSTVGRGCRIFGSLIHAQHNPLVPWDDPEGQEESPELKDEVFVGWGATVIGPVILGRRAYVCTGAIVSRPVPSQHIAFGRNQIVRYDEWPGPLQKSPFFELE